MRFGGLLAGEEGAPGSGAPHVLPDTPGVGSTQDGPPTHPHGPGRAPRAPMGPPPPLDRERRGAAAGGGVPALLRAAPSGMGGGGVSALNLLSPLRGGQGPEADGDEGGCRRQGGERVYLDSL